MTAVLRSRTRRSAAPGGDGVTAVAPKPTRAVGIRVIVGYKALKAGAEIVLGVLMMALGSAGVADDLRDIARAIERHATEAWSLALAARLVHAVTERRLLVIAWACLGDGAVSAIEGWALYRRYPWSGWLVVGATSCAIPFEVVALVRHASLGRFALLMANAAIAVYLVRRRIGNRRAGSVGP